MKPTENSLVAQLRSTWQFIGVFIAAGLAVMLATMQAHAGHGHQHHAMTHGPSTIVEAKTVAMAPRMSEPSVRRLGTWHGSHLLSATMSKAARSEPSSISATLDDPHPAWPSALAKTCTHDHSLPGHCPVTGGASCDCGTCPVGDVGLWFELASPALPRRGAVGLTMPLYGATAPPLERPPRA